MSRQLDFNAYFRTHHSIRMNEYKHKMDTKYPAHNEDYMSDLDVAKRYEGWWIRKMYAMNPKMKLGTLTLGTFVMEE